MAALGLEPGANRAAVERAYRALIKHHHPDRAGGDSARAAEINRAYRELREGYAARDDLIFDGGSPAAVRSRFGGAWLALLVALVVASLALVAAAGRGTPLFERSLTAGALRLVPARAQLQGDAMRGPLAGAEVEAAVGDAVRISRDGDEMALTSASRACHDRLRTAPTLALLDHCAAFDDAVVVLQDRDPLRDRGRFGELAVTGRQWSAARGMSDDMVAIDARLDQVRLKVELMLAAPPGSRTD